MSSVRRGRAWVFGDDVNTDAMAPGLYFKSSMDEMASHCLETLNPDFAAQLEPGDIVVGGRNFGMGSAREQAAMALQHLGVGAVLAHSFGRIFYRNALNFGIPALRLPPDFRVTEGEFLRVDFAAGTVVREADGADCRVEALPSHLLGIVTAGGLMPYLKRRLAGETDAGK